MLAAALDVTSEEDVRRGVDEAAAALGGLDVVVACAGVAGRGTEVNCVCPGPTTTPLLETYFALSADPAPEQARYAEAQVHGRLIEPEEIADAIAYLASPGASSTIGAALVVDGGYSIR
jgi:NAD(P)-dependent dehydrogenase (short-subunit alcohol dehydrogenase family)